MNKNNKNIEINNIDEKLNKIMEIKDIRNMKYEEILKYVLYYLGASSGFQTDMTIEQMVIEADKMKRKK